MQQRKFSINVQKALKVFICFKCAKKQQLRGSKIQEKVIKNNKASSRHHFIKTYELIKFVGYFFALLGMSIKSYFLYFRQKYSIIILRYAMLVMVENILVFDRMKPRLQKKNYYLEVLKCQNSSWKSKVILVCQNLTARGL